MAHNLIVDLDHTLIKIDLLQLSLKKAITHNPSLLFVVPIWIIKGKSYLKHKLVKRITIDVTTLPYNAKVISYIKERKKSGDLVILATASHMVYATEVAAHLNIFDRVLATTKDYNLSSHNKAKVLIAEFGEKNFDYIGDHTRDIPVWKVSDLSIIVREFATKKAVLATKNFNRLFID